MKFGRPVIPIVICLAAGIILERFLPIAFYIFIFPLVFCLFAAFLFYRGGSKKAAALFFLSGFIFLGLILSGAKDFQGEKTVKSLVALKQSRWINVEGRIVEPPLVRDGRMQFVLDVYRVNNDWSFKKKKIKAQVNCRVSGDFHTGKLKWGEVIKFSALIFPDRDVENPESFDYARYLRQRGIFLSLFVRMPEKILVLGSEGSFWSWVMGVRESLTYSVKNSLPEPSSNLLLGVVLGNRKELPADLEEDFKRTGTMHLLAASGLNVSIIIGFVLGAFSLFGFKSRISYFIAIFFIIFYAALAGASPSIVRASIMGVLFVIALLFEKQYDPLSALFAAAFLMLVWDPYNLFSVSFQLSFMAVLGIMLFYGPLRKLLPERKKIFERLNNFFKLEDKSLVRGLCVGYEFLVSTVVLSVIAQGFLLPILAYYFNQISLVNIAANIVMVPITCLALPVGLVGGLIGIPLLAVGRVIIFLLYYPLKIMIASAEILGELPYAALNVPSPGLAFFILYYAFCGVFAFSTDFVRKNRWLLITGLLSVSALFVLAGAWRTEKTHRLVVFKADQKYAMLVERKKGGTLYIHHKNAGRKKAREEFRWNLAPYLKSRGLYNLENLIITAEDGAQAADLDIYPEDYNFQNIFIDSRLMESKECRVLVDKARKSKAGVYFLNRDYRLEGGGEVLNISPLRRENEITLVYQWKGGEILVLAADSRLEETLKASPAGMRIFCIVGGSGYSEETAAKCRKINCYPVFVGDKAVIYDISGKSPRIVKW